MDRSIIISSELININIMRSFLDEIFTESCLNRNCFERVFLCLSEAVNNSIVHANGLNADKHVFIHVYNIENQLYMEIEDEGDGFAVDCIQNPTCYENLKKDYGRGIFLIHQFADEVEYSKGGRKVFIKYSLPR